MKTYDHPTILLTQPAAGHYVITGHSPANVPTDGGTVVPLDTCYISPEVPTDVLLGIIYDRGEALNQDRPPSGLEVIQNEIPSDFESGTPEQIAAVIRVLFERNVALTVRCEELEDKQKEPAKESTHTHHKKEKK